MTAHAEFQNRLVPDYAGVPVLVLGATGFIGRWVARLLSAGGAQMTCTVRDLSEARRVFGTYDIKATVVHVDLHDSSSLESVFAAHCPAVTFNLAGYGVDRSEQDERLSWRINAELVGELADLALRHSKGAWPGLRLVHTGSALEYGAIGGHLHESAVPNPDTLYGKTKLAGTQLLGERTALPSVTARLFTVYGPGEHNGRLLPSLMEGRGRPGRIPLSAGLQRRDFTYVEDVAEGLLRLGKLPAFPGGVANVATGKLYSVREFAETAAGVLGIPAGTLDFGALPQRTDEMPHDIVSVERLRQSIAWVPRTSIAAGVLRTAAFLDSLTA